VRRLVDYRDSAADPLDGRGPPRQVTGNTWSDPPASWPEGPFVGEDYNGFLEPGAHAALAVPDSGSWAFRGTHLRDGTRLPGVVASDVDSLEPGLGHPDDVQVLAHSPLPAWRGQAASHVGGVFYSDMTYYTAWESHAGVWDSGTNNWIPALRPGHGEPARAAATVRQVTANVLHLFGTGPADPAAYPNRPRRGSALPGRGPQGAPARARGGFGPSRDIRAACSVFVEDDRGAPDDSPHSGKTRARYLGTRETFTHIIRGGRSPAQPWRQDRRR
jgi:hypothetical protein